MAYQRATVRLNGVDDEVFYLRELSAAGVEALSHGDAGDSEYSQALVLIALSLTDEHGTPLYSPATLDEGLAAVRELPNRIIRDHLAPEAHRLNGSTVDDARKN